MQQTKARCEKYFGVHAVVRCQKRLFLGVSCIVYAQSKKNMHLHYTENWAMCQIL